MGPLATSWAVAHTKPATRSTISSPLGPLGGYGLVSTAGWIPLEYSPIQGNSRPISMLCGLIKNNLPRLRVSRNRPGTLCRWRTHEAVRYPPKLEVQGHVASSQSRRDVRYCRGAMLRAWCRLLIRECPRYTGCGRSYTTWARNRNHPVPQPLALTALSLSPTLTQDATRAGPTAQRDTAQPPIDYEVTTPTLLYTIPYSHAVSSLPISSPLPTPSCLRLSPLPPLRLRPQLQLRRPPLRPHLPPCFNPLPSPKRTQWPHLVQK